MQPIEPNMQPTRTEAIKKFLQAFAPADLAALYNYGMEVQVNVAQDDGERVDKTFNGRTYQAYTNGVQTWKPIRIPYKAATEPEYTDVPMTYDLSEHVEGIGMTGWNWEKKVSIWVAYDFDAITNHAKGLSELELEQIKELLVKIPWITLRYSTSGKGLHLYIFLSDPLNLTGGVPTINHTEHAALARAILGQLSALIGFNLSTKVDVSGGNMWVWHRKGKNTNGLTLIKQGEILTDIPINWRDHITVVKGDRKRVLPSQVKKGTEEELFEEMTSRNIRVQLDAEHRTLLEYLNSSGATWWFDNDRNMLIAHSWALQKAHETLGLRGIFKTISEGTDLATPNCFCASIHRGAWIVRRFTPGVSEDPSWSQDNNGWTKTFLNKEADLPTLARCFGGKEKESGGYEFNEAESAQKVAQKLGANIDLPGSCLFKKTIIKQHKDGRRLVMHIERTASDSNRGMEDWITDAKRWSKVLPVKHTPASESDTEVGDFDDIIRHMVNDNRDAGWAIRVNSTEGRINSTEGSTSNYWSEEPLAHVKMALVSMGNKVFDATVILGSAIVNNWKLVNVPFAEEYPGNRTWNRTAAQLAIKPNFEADPTTLSYPTWLKVLNHLGNGLDFDVKSHPWCINNGINTGGDYLKCWVASLFQFPLEQSPYLFFYSEKQNTGKSSFYEALTILMSKKAVVKASTALMSERNFNGELVSAVLCVVEELEISNPKKKIEIYSKIKDYVTGKTFQVHPKGVTPYDIPNSTHWVHMANSPKAVPIFQGDERIISIEVQPLTPMEFIPKKNLLEYLTEEAADFLAAILTLEIPPSNDRLNIPVISTELKEMAQQNNLTLMQQFITDQMHLIDGHKIIFKEFCKAFKDWATLIDETEWTSHKIRDELPSTVAYGASHMDNQRYVGNISFIEGAPQEKITSRDGKLFRGRNKI